VIRHFTASVAVVDDQDCVLLVQHRKSGLWLYPGGHVEANEDPEQAARREVREEVGIEIDIISDPSYEHPAVHTVANPFTIMVADVSDAVIGVHQHIDFVYAAQPRTTVLEPQIDEVDAARWVPIAETRSLPIPAELPGLFEAVARRLRRTPTAPAHGAVH
jgi:8-oxo-dGTP diphosphatase